MTQSVCSGRHLLELPHRFETNRMILIPRHAPITTLWIESVHNLYRLEVVKAIGHHEVRERRESLTRSQDAEVGGHIFNCCRCRKEDCAFSAYY
jgi:hypothetical protein